MWKVLKLASHTTTYDVKMIPNEAQGDSFCATSQSVPHCGIPDPPDRGRRVASRKNPTTFKDAVHNFESSAILRA